MNFELQMEKTIQEFIAEDNEQALVDALKVLRSLLLARRCNDTGSITIHLAQGNVRKILRQTIENVA